MAPRRRIHSTDPLTRFRNQSDAQGRPAMGGKTRLGLTATRPATETAATPDSTASDPFLVAAADSPVAYRVHAAYICDGIDDQTEINAAIADATADRSWSGGEVRLAPGVYHITGTIDVSSGTLAGCASSGYTSSPYISVAADIGNVAAISLSGSGGLRNVYLDGGGYDVAAGVQMGANARVTDCYIVSIGPSSGGFMAAGTNDCHGIAHTSTGAPHIRGNRVSYCSGDGIRTAAGGVVADNVIVHVGLAGINQSASSDTRIYGNDITNSGDAVRASPTLSGSGIVCAGNESTVIGNKVSVAEGAGVRVTGDAVRVLGNHVDEPSLAGIVVDGASYVGVHDNSVEMKGGHGVLLDGASFAVVTGNVITHWGGTVSVDGINIATSDHNLVTGNKVHAEDLTSDIRFGINVADSGCDANVVAGNDLTQGTYGTAPLSDSGTGTVLTYPGHATYGDNFT